MPAPSILPDVPVKHADFISYIESHPNIPLLELLEPYKQYDAKLREVFAQESDHPSLVDQHLNIVPVFNGHEQSLKIRARALDSETPEEKERYIMPLDAADRRPNNSPAVVQGIEVFQQNFALFCESSLVDLDWSNVVAAGSAVATCLLPVPEQYSKSKKALRQYYHEKVAPASDVDLFLYGLDEEDAVKKIIEIEQRVKDSILTETTTIRTKNAITIASQYPTRHIQIVLRIYRSVSEILTGFDVDCSCAAYDGTQVWAAPRALTAYMTQTNTIDLTRRSPSYENRLSKYSRRGFEIYWPLLERSRVDPTIFERNFARTVGLARLLVLERLPSKSEREAYMDERRRERGRPRVNRLRTFRLRGNIKETYEDEVAEWVEQEDISDYHTFTIPYGPKYHAKKIEKLLYTKDLLLNAEWNKSANRDVNLHRHPAFFGYAEDVIDDCCGFCPQPVTPEEYDVAEEERKIYVSGKVSFIKDNPGRQAIGSFNPITEDDWTEMAYVGNSARLCQAIIDCDLEHVLDWLAQEGSDPNCRDYTGRTPLHLAVTSSSPEVVRALIDHGARLVARLADGRTALHLAAARGNVEMVRMIMQKSEENEEEEAKKEDIRKKARMAAREPKQGGSDKQKANADVNDDFEMIDEDDVDSDNEARTSTTKSYVKVKEDEKKTEDVVPEEDEAGPDVYDVNVLAWDLQCSPLHLAILNGHIEVVKELVQSFGADVLLPIKLFNDYDKSPRGAILNLVLAVHLPLETAQEMTKTLLSLGASSSQADMHQVTALHHISAHKPELVETLMQHDEPAARRVINHLSVLGGPWNPTSMSPLTTAIWQGNAFAASMLLEAGASPVIEFHDWVKSVESRHTEITQNDSAHTKGLFNGDIEQPIVLAVQTELPDIALRLLEMGADPNTFTRSTRQVFEQQRSYTNHGMELLLDVVRQKIIDLRGCLDGSQHSNAPSKPQVYFEDGVDYLVEDGVDYLEGIAPGSYKYFIAQIQLERAKESNKQSSGTHETLFKPPNERKEFQERKEAIEALLKRFLELEQALQIRGAKTFNELYPAVTAEESRPQAYFGLPSGFTTVFPSGWPFHEPKPKPFAISFEFGVHDLTEQSREAYLELFQAAWDNNLEQIKALTLAPWGESGHTPLKISVQDKEGNNVFGIAALRGHLDLARTLVEICYAQFQLPEEDKFKSRYRIVEDDEDDEDGENADSETNDIPLYEEIVDDKFTIDNVGELSTQVKSDVSPLSFLSFECPTWRYARYMTPDKPITYGVDERTIDAASEGASTCNMGTWSLVTNDKRLFSFILDLNVEWTDRLAKGLDGSSGIPSFSMFDFQTAVEYGRVELLAEMIRHTGAGIDLGSLVRASGVPYREKPKYYQGLSVHGKKRPGWIRAARGARRTRSYIPDGHPPLLHAVFKGSLQSVEWFLSDSPVRHYLDFFEAYKHDKRIEHLNKNAGGFERLLRKWLGTRSELALHLAVMAEPRPETAKLIKYLMDTMPESLETKSVDGYTPLALAFSLHRFDAAKILIDAGADQMSRTSTGSNILDLLLVDGYTYKFTHDASELQRMLGLIDTRLKSSLLLQRTSTNPGSLTPIAHWMQRPAVDWADDDSAYVAVFTTLLDFAAPTNYAFLELLDGSGDTPLHVAVKTLRRSYVTAILERRPDLLHRENSVGRTPLEIAEDAYLADRVRDAPSFMQRSWLPVTQRDMCSFAKDYVPPRQVITNEDIRHVCNEFAAKAPSKRKLVSLLDANEVANRLAKRQMARRVADTIRNEEPHAEDEEYYGEAGSG